MIVPAFQVLPMVLKKSSIEAVLQSVNGFLTTQKTGSTLVEGGSFWSKGEMESARQTENFGSLT